jgi:rRNA maturation endonuclease Nob1
MIVCRGCLRKYVVDWMVLGLASGVCEVCGAAADFEVDFATVNAELKREG